MTLVLLPVLRVGIISVVSAGDGGSVAAALVSASALMIVYRFAVVPFLIYLQFLAATENLMIEYICA